VFEFAEVDVSGPLARLAGCEAQIRALQAEQLELAAEVARLRREEFADDDRPTVERAIAMEVAAAMRSSAGSADCFVADADALTGRHPAVLTALRAGRVGLYAARQIAAATECLADERALALDEALAEEAAQLLPGQVRAAADARAAAADPDAAANRAQAARARRRVWVKPHQDAVATLGATLPAEQALACWHALDDHARGRRADGDDRGIDAIMSDTLVERITGAARADASPAIELQLVMTDTALLGAAATTAELVGAGAIPSDLAKQLTRDADAWVRRLLTDPIDATVTAIDTRRRRFTGAARELILIRDRRCRSPLCNAVVRDADHRIQWSAGGQTAPSNADAYCQRCHHLKDHPAITVTRRPDPTRPSDAHKIVWTTPSGRQHQSLAPPALGHGTPTLHQLQHRRTLLAPDSG
jgi:hypothetical protein